MGAQSRLNFTGLDSVAQNFDLSIDPSQKFDDAILPPSRHISGSVHPCPSLLDERVCHELLARCFGIIQVAPRETHAGSVELADFAKCNRAHILVEDIYLRIRNRPPDWNRVGYMIAVTHREAASEGRVFGRSIAVDQTAVRKLVQHSADMPRRNHVATG